MTHLLAARGLRQRTAKSGRSSEDIAAPEGAANVTSTSESSVRPFVHDMPLVACCCDRAIWPRLVVRDYVQMTADISSILDRNNLAAMLKRELLFRGDLQEPALAYFVDSRRRRSFQLAGVLLVACC